MNSMVVFGSAVALAALAVRETHHELARRVKDERSDLERSDLERSDLERDREHYSDLRHGNEYRTMSSRVEIEEAEHAEAERQAMVPQAVAPAGRLTQRAPAGLVLDQGQSAVSILPTHVAVNAGGAEVLRVMGGNVGIGVTQPTYALHVNGAAMVGANVWLGNSTNGLAATASALSVIGQQSGQLATLSTGAVRPVLTWTNTNQVGINTTAPWLDLEVKGARGLAVTHSASSNAVLLQTSTSQLVGTASVLFQSFDNNGVTTSSAPYDALIQSTRGTPNVAGGGTLLLKAGLVRLVAGSAPGVTVAPSGYVGVGTDAPSSALHVAGYVTCAGFTGAAPMTMPASMLLLSGAPLAWSYETYPLTYATGYLGTAAGRYYYLTWPHQTSLAWPNAAACVSANTAAPLPTALALAVPYTGVYSLVFRFVHAYATAPIAAFTLFAARNSAFAGTDLASALGLVSGPAAAANGVSGTELTVTAVLAAGDQLTFGVVVQNSAAGTYTTAQTNVAVTLLQRTA